MDAETPRTAYEGRTSVAVGAHALCGKAAREHGRGGGTGRSVRRWGTYGAAADPPRLAGRNGLKGSASQGRRGRPPKPGKREDARRRRGSLGAKRLEQTPRTPPTDVYGAAPAEVVTKQSTAAASSPSPALRPPDRPACQYASLAFWFRASKNGVSL